MNKLNVLTYLGSIELLFHIFFPCQNIVKYLPLFDIERPNTFIDLFVILKENLTCNPKIYNPTLVQGFDTLIFYIVII